VAHRDAADGLVAVRGALLFTGQRTLPGSKPALRATQVPRVVDDLAIGGDRQPIQTKVYADLSRSRRSGSDSRSTTNETK